MLPLCFPEWDVIGNALSYGLYRRLGQEHITPIERIPDLPLITSRQAQRQGVPARGCRRLKPQPGVSRRLTTPGEPVRSWCVSDGPSSGQFQIRLGRLPGQQVPDAIYRA